MGKHSFAMLQLCNTATIMIKEDSSPYERDTTLFHELAHLHYSPPDNLATIFVSRDNLSYKQMEASIEWIGRKVRADPTLLRHAVLAFGLEPYVYDQASYQAFNNLVRQPALPILESFLMMD